MKTGVKRFKPGSFTVTIMVALFFITPAVSLAGELEPDAAPGSTMHTLEEVYANTAKIKALQETLYAFIGQTTRFLDMNNGTVKDMRTGLVWLKDASCFGPQAWDVVTASVAELSAGECGLSDGSTAGQWRLPTIEELQGIGTDPPTTWDVGSPFVTWTMPDLPFVNVQTGTYWSGTVYNTTYAWYLVMDSGFRALELKDYSFYIWPVRADN